jgi:hypothetical protein
LDGRPTFVFVTSLGLADTGSLKNNAVIKKTHHSKTVKHIEMIQVLK